MRYRALFFAVFVCTFVSFAKEPFDTLRMIEYNDFPDIVSHYYKILSENRLKNGGRQKQNCTTRTDFRKLVPDYYAMDIAQRKFKKYYRDIARLYWGNDGLLCHDCSIIMRQIGEYAMVRYLRRLNSFEQEQIWFLISSETGKFLSTYRDTIPIAKKSIAAIRAEERAKQEHEKEVWANVYYNSILTKRKLYGDGLCPSRKSMSDGYDANTIFYEQWSSMDTDSLRLTIKAIGDTVDSVDQRSLRKKLETLSRFPNNNKNIDSVAATKIAIVAAAACYGSEMTPFMTRLMGDNKEHWMVYCFPTIPFQTKQQDDCYKLRTSNPRSVTFYGSTECSPVFIILVSRENGQVLAIAMP